MISELTAARIDYGLAALKLAQLRGCPVRPEDGREIPVPGEVSLRDISRFTGVSLGEVHAFEKVILKKVARGLRSQGLPSELVGRFCKLIDDPQQPELF